MTKAVPVGWSGLGLRGWDLAFWGLGIGDFWAWSLVIRVLGFRDYGFGA